MSQLDTLHAFHLLGIVELQDQKRQVVVVSKF